MLELRDGIGARAPWPDDERIAPPRRPGHDNRTGRLPPPATAAELDSTSSRSHPDVLSRCWRRSWAASSTSL
jgi:hypothetical protein